MNRCDFSAVTTILRDYISEDRGINQTVFLDHLFEDFIKHSDKSDQFFCFDNGLVCRWMNGDAKVSPRISSYYMRENNQNLLAQTIVENIFPMLYDIDMAVQELYTLLIQDIDISESKKETLCKYHPAKTEAHKALFMAQLLAFSMERKFINRDTQTELILQTGALSPMVRNRIFNATMPTPCAHFCGRNTELDSLHTVLSEQRKLFVCGIAGIGKSELVKAYAKAHKKDYTNIIYLAYHGNLKQAIIDLEFVDDTAQDTPEILFRKHNRFLRSLKEDTLLVIDNFNVPLTQDELLPVVLKYRCHVLITTRNAIKEHPSISVAEMASIEDLFQLVAHFYTDAAQQRDLVEDVIAQVHSHTFAVEMAARLLETGLLEPSELLEKLSQEKAAFHSTDQININKDGSRKKATYYQHLHLLFSLFHLSESSQTVLQNLALIPSLSIPMRLFARWISLPNLNDINDLIELGLVQAAQGSNISLHPLIAEIALVDMAPSCQTCQPLLSTLQLLCLRHGETVSYYKTIFQAVESIISHIAIDDTAFYLLFLFDIYPYMETYHYYSGMRCILSTLQTLLQDPAVGTTKDRALLLDYQAIYHDRVLNKPQQALSLEKQALSLVTQSAPENASLIANLHSNIATIYQSLNRLPDAKWNMEQGLHLLQTNQLLNTHDFFTQACNYSLLLAAMGEYAQGLHALQQLAQFMRQSNYHQDADYAYVLQQLGYLYLLRQEIPLAQQHLEQAIYLYHTIFADNPELFEAKYQSILQLTAVASQKLGKPLTLLNSTLFAQSPDM